MTRTVSDDTYTGSVDEIDDEEENRKLEQNPPTINDLFSVGEKRAKTTPTTGKSLEGS